jgi:hypothetical protein
MADQRPRLAASEIEEELLRELQKLPTPWGLSRASSPT